VYSSEQNKSAFTDHDSDVINRSKSAILDRESDRGTRWIAEAVQMGKKGQRSTNWNEVSYTPSHTYNRFIATSHHYCGKNPPPKEAARPAIAVGLLLWARRPGVIDRLLHVGRSAANAASHVADSADGDSQTSRRYLRMHGRPHTGENGVS